MDYQTKISIIVVSCNELRNLQNCINSIRTHSSKSRLEIIIIDNASNDGTCEWLAEQTDIITLLNSEEIGYSKACNKATQIASGDYFLFISPHIIVTPNWLSHLTNFMLNDIQIGAIGPMSNIAQSLQTHHIKYSSVEELNSIAESIHLQESENRMSLVLSSFCFMVRCEVWELIEGFDERFATPETATYDLSLRIYKKKFKLIICSNVYLHSNSDQLPPESDIEFEEKWGFPVEKVAANIHLLKSLSSYHPNSTNRILHLGSGCGATIQSISQMFPFSKVSGIEGNLSAASIALGQLENIHKTTILSNEVLESEKYDIILLDAGTLQGAEQVIKSIPSKLKRYGILIAIFPNRQHYSRIQGTLQSFSIDKNTYDFPTLARLFESAGYVSMDVHHEISVKTEDCAFLDDLKKWVSSDTAPLLETESFVILARISTEEEAILATLSELSLTSDDSCVEALFSYSTEKIISVILSSDLPIISLLNYLGIVSFQHKRLEHVMPYLTAAFEVDPRDSTTIMNIATILYSIGEAEKALLWLKKINKPLEHVNNWIETISEEITEENTRTFMLKFAMRRIENDVEREETISQILDWLNRGISNINDIIKTAENDVVKKDVTLNIIATHCFEQQLYENVLPLLEASLQHNPNNSDTLFNIAVCCLHVQDYQNARYYLQQIKSPDKEVNSLLTQIEELTIDG